MKNKSASLGRCFAAFAVLAACFAAFCLCLPRVARAETNGIVGDVNTLLPEKIMYGVPAELDIPTPAHGDTIIFTVAEAGGESVSFGADLTDGVSFFETKADGDSITLDSTKPVEGADENYFSDYINGLTAGNYTVTALVPAFEEYATYTRDFSIEVLPYNIAEDTAELFSWRFVDKAEVVYNGEINNIPEIEVAFDGKPLTLGADYTLGSSTVNVGESALYIVGNGNFGGTVTVEAAFAILPAENSWTLAPSVNTWNFGEFDASRHGFNAVPRFLEAGQSVIYTVSREFVPDGVEIAPDDPMYVPIEGLKDIPDLELMGDDDRAETVALLGALPVGTYYLTAHVNPTNNYSAIPPIVSQFTVGVAQNGWLVTPNIMQWRYGSYDKTFNIVEAEAKYTDKDHPVLYTVSTDREGNSVVSGLKEFTAPDGVVADHIAETLGGLDVGTYYLTATVKKSNNFNAAPSVSRKFEIIQAINFWDESPSVENWVVGAFDPDVNKVAGTPHFGTASVIITDATENRNVVYDRLNNLNDLASVGAGTYILTAVVKEADNYTGLSASFVFRVGVPETKLVKRGLPWWGTLIIVVAALGIVALVFCILHKKGVFKMMSGKVLDLYMERQTQKVIAATLYAKKRDEALRAAAEAEAQNAAATTVEAEEIADNELPASNGDEPAENPDEPRAEEKTEQPTEETSEEETQVTEEETSEEEARESAEEKAEEETQESAEEKEEELSEAAAELNEEQPSDEEPTGETEAVPPEVEETDRADESVQVDESETAQPEKEAAATKEPKQRRTKKEADVKIVKNAKTGKSSTATKKSTTGKKSAAAKKPAAAKSAGKNPTAKKPAEKPADKNPGEPSDGTPKRRGRPSAKNM